MDKWMIGLGGSDHEFSAALMCGSDIRVAIEQERLSRRKHGFSHWYQDPVRQSIEYCLLAEGRSMDEIMCVVSSDLLPTRVRHDLRPWLREFPHHLCHAASAYLMLPEKPRAGIIVFDGFGSVRGAVAGMHLQNLRETFSFFIFGPTGYEILGGTTGAGYIEQDGFPTGVTNSIGMLYELVTALLGYDLLDAGKTMGLAAYGTPRYLSIFEKFVSYEDDIENCFVCSINDPRLFATLEEILLAGRAEFRVKADLAASVQAVANKALLHCSRFFHNREIEYLCLSGGCALNTVANSFLVEHLALNVPVIVAPHCGDMGIGFGALWLEVFQRTGAVPNITFRGKPTTPSLSRPGKCYLRTECQRAVQEFYPRLAFDSSVRNATELATLIAEGAIVGVFSGGSEIGPRALGGRSIIADPRLASTRERINRLIKGREPYRPLAPMILKTHYDDYFFDSRQADPFMLKVARARELCLREAPAIVHVDGTARVQVIGDGGDPFLVELLHAFHSTTGRRVLLNTSFNRKGEPIVESPCDAIDAFLGMKLDGLYLDGEFYRSVG